MADSERDRLSFQRTPQPIALPSVKVQDPGLQSFLDAMKGAIEALANGRGGLANQAITWGAAYRQGLVVLRDTQGNPIRPPGGGTLPPVEPPDGPINDVPPPAPTGVVASGGLGVILLSWNAPDSRRVAYAEIFSAANDDIGLAVKIGETFGPTDVTYRDVVGSAAARYYWVRFVGWGALALRGPFQSTAGVLGQTSADPSYLLELLDRAITESQLANALATRIDLVDGNGAGSVNARIAAEAAARIAAITQETNDRIAAVQAEANARAQGLIDEAAARTAAIAVETSARQTADSSISSQITTLTSSVGANASAIEAEAIARSDGDSAEATARNTLATQLRGNYTGSDLSLVTSGLLFSERTARVNADNALTQQISLLSAGAGEQFDYKSIWYFDSGVDSFTTPTSGVTLSSVGGWLRLVSNSGSVSDPQMRSPSLLNISGPQYPQVMLRVRRVGTPTWEGAVYFITDADQTYDETKKATLAAPTWPTDNIAVLRFDMPSAWTATGAVIRQVRLDLATAVTTTDYFEVDWVAIGRPSPGASAAALLEEQTARASGDSAETTARQALSTKITGAADPSSLTLATLSSGLLFDERQSRSSADTTEVTARQALSAKLTGANDPASLTLGTLSSGLIFDERQARVTGDSANATSISNLSATVSTNYSTLDARITTVDNARVSGDSALTTSINTVSASKNRTFRQPSAPVNGGGVTLIAGDLWFDSDDNNKAYRYSGSAWEATDDARINQVAVAVQDETTARIAADGTLYAQKFVKIDINGFVTGYGIAASNNGPTGTPESEFIARVNRFAIVPPTGATGATAPFYFQATPTTINGVAVPAGLYVSSAFIADGSIASAKIGLLQVDDSRIANLVVDKLLSGDIQVGRYIQSTGFAAGSTGWQINGDGTAEFAAASIRGQLTAAQIDSRNLTIRDANGNVLFGAGTALNWGNIVGQPSGIYNSNISINANGTLNGGGGGQVSLGGLGAGALAFINQITAGNAATYIGPQAIVGNLVALGTLTADRFSTNLRADQATLIRNSDFTDYAGTNSGIAALPGWGQYTGTLPANHQIVRNNGGGRSWNVGRGGSVIYYNQPGYTGETGIYQRVGVNGSVQYEFHFAGSLHRTNGRIAILWYDGGNNYITQTSQPIAEGVGTGDPYAPPIICWFSVTSPPNAASADVYIIATSATGADSYLFMHRVHFAPLVAGASATNPTPWRPGGVVEIHGGAITAETLNADRITANTITTNRLVGGAVNDIFTYERNALKGQSTDTISAVWGSPWTMTTLCDFDYTPPVNTTVIIQVDSLIRHAQAVSNGGSYSWGAVIGAQVAASPSTDWSQYVLGQDTLDWVAGFSGPASKDFRIIATELVEVAANTAVKIRVAAAKFSSSGTSVTRRVRVVVQCVKR